VVRIVAQDEVASPKAQSWYNQGETCGRKNLNISRTYPKPCGDARSAPCMKYDSAVLGDMAAGLNCSAFGMTVHWAQCKSLISD
jgi:hypothetical protein